MAGRAKPRGLMLHQNLAANIVLERQKNGATASAPQRTRPKAATAAHKAAAHKTRQRSNGRRLPSGGFGSHAEKAAEYASFKAEKASQLNAAKAAAMAKAKMAERLAASAEAKAEEKVLNAEARALAMFKTKEAAMKADSMGAKSTGDSSAPPAPVHSQGILDAEKATAAAQLRGTDMTRFQLLLRSKLCFKSIVVKGVVGGSGTARQSSGIT